MPATAMVSGGGDDAPVFMERKTRGGRTLQYRLTVLQQPERARACGSGSKSAADRRPVDPPPVVELCIFELGPNGERKDITFHYNANFFLFATLEVARPMAHGRVQTPAATGTPVLTGMPVSGMAYLDRPQEAGYFLFPDLSVRHEGRYKLSFNLYEEAKEEKDFDEETSESKHSPVGASFDWRMEVKSVQFQVFSAKRFPGLTESTALSRTVAEQGCRVRIRRDVRMRRRDPKPSGGDYKKSDDDYVHRPSARTPERQLPHDYRQRSSSAASEHGRMPYPPEPQRRPSIAESYPTAAPPPPPPPPGYNQNVHGGHHLGFGNNTPRLPPQYSSAQPPASPTSAYPSNNHYQAQQNQSYNYGNRPASQSYGSSRSSYEERRLSNPYPPHSPQYPPSLSGDAPKLEADSMPMEPRSSHGYSSGQIAPPSSLLQNQDSKSVASDMRLPSLKHMLNLDSQGPGGAPHHLPSPRTVRPDVIEADPNMNASYTSPPSIPTGSKRPLEDAGYSQPLYNGQRPKMENNRGLTYPELDNGGSMKYPGLRFQDPNGSWKHLTENTFYPT